jgi:hypothetical protein
MYGASGKNLLQSYAEIKDAGALYRMRQANFLFRMAFHIQKRKLAYRTLYN